MYVLLFHQNNDSLSVYLNQEDSRRNIVSEDNGLDFEVDLTDLETFGETTSIKTTKTQNKIDGVKKKIQNVQDACVQNKKTTSAPPLSKLSSEHLVKTSSSSQEEINTSMTDKDESTKEETSQLAQSETIVLKTKQETLDSAQESDEDLAFMGDSDDEKLVIDDIVSPASTPTEQCTPNTACSADSPVTPASESVSVTSELSPSEKSTRKKRQPKRVKVSGDQLSEILRMQTAMFSSASDPAKSSTIVEETDSQTPCAGLSVHSHPVSLVKPCVTSYLERANNQDGQTCTAPHESAPLVNIPATEHKS